MKTELKLYMNGYAGSLGAARFALSNMRMLQERFREDYLEVQLAQLEADCTFLNGKPILPQKDACVPVNDNSVIPEAMQGTAKGETSIPENARGFEEEGISIMDEIYRIAAREKRGFAVHLRKIPIRQFTIEICELAGMDPYHIDSAAQLFVRRSDEAVPEEDKKSPAVCIGCTSQGLDVTLIR